MKNLKALKFGLPIVAVLIALASSAFTTAPKSAFAITYYANEGDLSTPVFPTQYTNITSTVNGTFSGRIANYDNSHCTNPSSLTCTVEASSGVIVQSFLGAWHS
jgi:hypothetical protein